MRISLFNHFMSFVPLCFRNESFIGVSTRFLFCILLLKMNKNEWDFTKIRQLLIDQDKFTQSFGF